jgi:hypothetical protein
MKVAAAAAAAAAVSEMSAGVTGVEQGVGDAGRQRDSLAPERSIDDTAIAGRGEVRRSDAASAGAGAGGALPWRQLAPLDVVVRPVMGDGAGVQPPPPQQNIHFVDRTAHSAARAQLLELIARHAGDELRDQGSRASTGGGGLGGGGWGGEKGALGVALPPPKLAMQEMEARKEAVVQEGETRLRRQNAVHALLKKVAKQNETRAKRSKDSQPDGGADAASVYKPPIPTTGTAAADEAPRKTAAESIEHRASARERTRPWRSNIKPTFWAARGSAAKKPPSGSARNRNRDRKDAPPPTWGPPPVPPAAAPISSAPGLPSSAAAGADGAAKSTVATTAEDAAETKRRFEIEGAKRAEVHDSIPLHPKHYTLNATP